MIFTAGTKLGAFEIISLLGEGGMGQVYRARDPRLQRDVALKLLPSAFASDNDRLARFQREAQLLAQLNHPNIAAIYGLEESKPNALVLELVDGPTLAERIAQGPIPLDEVLPIAKQIAEALEYAHEHGVMHRDLKPANIKLKRDGTVKVLDFGLAKALNEDARSPVTSNSPTLSLAATQAGVILGTAAYMSPEQAKGKEVDRRADIWAFGVVVYEMLTGRMAFSAETASETMAAVMLKEPDWDALPKNTPSRLKELLRRCLVKEPRNRLRDIGEARIAIEKIAAHPKTDVAQTSISIPVSPQRRASGWLTWGAAVAGLLIGAGLVQFADYFHPSPKNDIGAIRFSVTAPEKAQWTAGPSAPYLTLSPDGRSMAFVAQSADGNTRLWIRSLDSLES